MSLPRWAVERPVSTLMATTAVAVFGYLALRELPVALLPDLSYPTLTVQTTYPDASPLSVERLVTRPIEEAVGVIPGVRDMHSVSRAGTSEVVLEFEWDESMDLSTLAVREKLGLVELPREAERPRVLRYDPAQDPVMRLSLAGSDDLELLREHAERWLKRELEGVDGVAAAKVQGGIEAEVEVAVDPLRLAQLGLTFADVSSALQRQDVNLPGGSVVDRGAIFLVRTLHEFTDLTAIRRTVLRQAEAGGVVRVEDVARVARVPTERKEITRVDGGEAVEIGVYREGETNAVRVAAAIREALAELEPDLPPGLSLTVLSDGSRYVSAAIDAVWSAALGGGLLAILVLFFFLRDLPSTAIVAATIPASVIATFLPLQLAGVSLNVMSLGGLALGVGMLVDNSIVVLEAIARRREGGAARADAAARGAEDVAGAVAAATFTTVSVFVPIVFVKGVAGQLFYDLAVTVCLSLLASLLVALTLIPTLAAREGGLPLAGGTLFPWDRVAADEARQPWTFRWGRWELPPVGDGRHWFSRTLTALLFLPRILAGLVGGVVYGVWLAVKLVFLTLTWPVKLLLSGVEATYPKVLGVALEHRALVLVAASGLLVVAWFLGRQLGHDLVPSLAQGNFAFRLTLPEGTPLETTSSVVARVERELGRDPRFARVFSSIGTLPSAGSGRQSVGENLAQIDLALTPPVDGEREAEAVSAVREVLAGFPRARAELVVPQALNLRPPVQVDVFAADLETLWPAALQVELALRGVPALRDVRSTREPGAPEVRIALRRERAAQQGLTVQEIAEELRRMLRGDAPAKFREGERRIDVRVITPRATRSRASAVRDLPVRLPSGQNVPVFTVAEVTEDSGPAAIHRARGSRVVRIQAEIQGADLAAALDQVRAALAPVSLGTATYELAGQDQELELSYRSLQLALTLAVFLVFAVMATQFESLRTPFVVLCTVPLGGVGVVLGLWVTGTPVSVLVLIGAVMLAGIVVNNAIVLVDAVLRVQRGGASLYAAILEGARLRLRPIIMTTTTTVLGLAPLALGFGEGGELRRPLAIAVVAGLSVATLLTVIVVPCLTSLLAADTPEPEATPLPPTPSPAADETETTP
ncbi:MAG: efflux RND transporter permease subunit [Planctomycetota bacterium]